MRREPGSAGPASAAPAVTTAAAGGRMPTRKNNMDIYSFSTTCHYQSSPPAYASRSRAHMADLAAAPHRHVRYTCARSLVAASSHTALFAAAWVLRSSSAQAFLTKWPCGTSPPCRPSGASVASPPAPSPAAAPFRLLQLHFACSIACSHHTPRELSGSERIWQHAAHRGVGTLDL